MFDTEKKRCSIKKYTQVLNPETNKCVMDKLYDPKTKKLEKNKNRRRH